MEEEEDARPKKVAGGSATGLFLALYLLLLAFFILLNTISTFEEVKTKQVQESLSSAFASILPPTTSLNPLTSLEGPIIEAQELQETLGELFETTVKVVRVKVVQPGKLMEVIMHADQLFERDTAQLRDSKSDFMDRLARAMEDAPDGMHYEVEMLLGIEPGNRGRLSASQTLPVARAGTFARAMQERGAPRDSVFVGLDPSGDPFLITFYFYWELDSVIEQEGTPVSATPSATQGLPSAPGGTQ